MGMRSPVACPYAHAVRCRTVTQYAEMKRPPVDGQGMATNGQCRVCSHPQRRYIDALLLGGATIRDVWRDLVEPLAFCSEATLNRHARLHSGEDF